MSELFTPHVCMCAPLTSSHQQVLPGQRTVGSVDTGLGPGGGADNSSHMEQ